MKVQELLGKKKLVGSAAGVKEWYVTSACGRKSEVSSWYTDQDDNLLETAFLQCQEDLPQVKEYLAKKRMLVAGFKSLANEQGIAAASTATGVV